MTHSLSGQFIRALWDASSLANQPLPQGVAGHTPGKAAAREGALAYSRESCTQVASAVKLTRESSQTSVSPSLKWATPPLSGLVPSHFTQGPLDVKSVLIHGLKSSPWAPVTAPGMLSGSGRAGWAPGVGSSSRRRALTAGTLMNHVCGGLLKRQARTFSTLNTALRAAAAAVVVIAAAQGQGLPRRRVVAKACGVRGAWPPGVPRA